MHVNEFTFLYRLSGEANADFVLDHRRRFREVIQGDLVAERDRLQHEDFDLAVRVQVGGTSRTRLDVLDGNTDVVALVVHEKLRGLRRSGSAPVGIWH